MSISRLARATHSIYLNKELRTKFDLIISLDTVCSRYTNTTFNNCQNEFIEDNLGKVDHIIVSANNIDLINKCQLVKLITYGNKQSRFDTTSLINLPELKKLLIECKLSDFYQLRKSINYRKINQIERIEQIEQTGQFKVDMTCKISLDVDIICRFYTDKIKSIKSQSS
ncbi:hypothetical protein K502DRAFT_345451 [Neoconidiobolus thromboides FSU 785]|nr:hypothetical protein K502DRAFT_345451 [Neoconidiobolus thromboides FSU 785]